VARFVLKVHRDNLKSAESYETSRIHQRVSGWRQCSFFGQVVAGDDAASGLQVPLSPLPADGPYPLPDLRPARWIWYPSERTPPNTFVLFRRQLDLPDKPHRAKGWVVADGRYLLTVNGQRVQWGPAPSDPRWIEVDPADLTEMLRPGANTIGAQVLYYGHGMAPGHSGSAAFCFGWSSRRTPVRSKRLSRTHRGEPSWLAPGSPGTTSAGTCAVFRKNSMRGSILTDGRIRTSSSRRIGSPPCRSTVLQTSPPSAPPTPNTCWICRVNTAPRSCAPAVSRPCARTWCPFCGSPNRVRSHGLARLRSTSIFEPPMHSMRTASLQLASFRRSVGG